MKYLIDTHVLLWMFSDTGKLSRTAIETIDSPDNDILVSPLSVWEISIKESIGKFSMNGFDLKNLPEITRQNGLSFIDITADDYASYSSLPHRENHKDPFDRMLIHLAIRKNIPLISCDSKFGEYSRDGLRLIW